MRVRSAALRVSRHRIGLSQEELAKKAGINATYLCQLETGKRTGGYRALHKLATILNVPIEVIAILTDDKEDAATWENQRAG